MKLRRLIGVIVPLLAGVAAALWTPFGLWIDMKEGLIAFLGFLAASLVQVMPITANFLQSDRLSPREAERLTASLTRQQRYWMGLLSATIFAMVIVIVSAALKDKGSGVVFSTASITMTVGLFLTLLISASVSFVLVKMLGLFEGMMSLHHLRAELVLNAAKRQAAEEVAAFQRETVLDRPLVPENYGQILHPH